MTVTCPDCKSVFRVDPAKVPATGVRARCSVCGGVISISGGTLPIAVTPLSSRSVSGSYSTSPQRGTGSAHSSLQAPVPVVDGASAVRPKPTIPPADAAHDTADHELAGADTRAAAPAPVVAAPFPVPSVVSPTLMTPPVPTGLSTPEPMPAPTPEPTTGVGATPPTGKRSINPFLNADPGQRARRLARALVSDLIAYHPKKREDGLRDGTLRQLFRDEIKKSYEEYVDQVGREVAEGSPYFQDALNEILGGGRKLF